VDGFFKIKFSLSLSTRPVQLKRECVCVVTERSSLTWWAEFFTPLPGILAVTIGVRAVSVTGGGRLVLGLEPEVVDGDSCSTNDGGNNQGSSQECGVYLHQAGCEVDEKGPGLVTGQSQLAIKVTCGSRS